MSEQPYAVAHAATTSTTHRQAPTTNPNSKLHKPGEADHSFKLCANWRLKAIQQGLTRAKLLPCSERQPTRDAA